MARSAADEKRLDEFVKMIKVSAKDGDPRKVIHASWAVSEALPCLETPVTE